VLTVFLRRMTWTGIRRGGSGQPGAQAWMILAILAIGARTLRRLARSEPEVLYRTKIKAGDVLVLGAKEPAPD
jgi:hypothetical protein